MNLAFHPAMNAPGRSPRKCDLMSSGIQILLGLSMVSIAAVADGFLPLGGSIWPMLTGILAFVLAIGGRGLPLMVRVVATGVIFFFAFQLFLIGRTAEPFLSGYTVGMAITFGCIAVVPGLALIRGWQGRARIWLCSLMLPISFASACLVAAYEESQFVAQHRNGVGPTNRWTVPMHWLSYDAATQKLQGSD